MPRLLNLNDFSGKFLTLIFVLAAGLPALLYLLDLAFRVFHVDWSFLLTLMRISMGLGLALLALMLVLIVLEQIQDRWIVSRYDQARSKPLPAADGWFECQYCGNRRVKPQATTCEVCGKRLGK